MTYVTLILNAAKAAKVSAPLLLAICMHESNLKNIEVKHDGGSSSYGICQVKEGTAKMLGYSGSAEGLMDPAINAKYAALYLRYQTERYESDLCKAVSAYNAGTYNESKLVPGMPKNLKYVRLVQNKLEQTLQNKLSCIKNKEVMNFGEIVRFDYYGN